MTVYLKPSPKQFREAFSDHGVQFVEHPQCSLGRSAWTHGLRAATVHHTASKGPSATYLATAWNLPGANACINNGHYNGLEHDGRAVILSWGDCWHPGQGGPWPGVAARDSLHLVSWGIEVESLGDRKDITAAQVETVGRMLAALVDLGMPRRNAHRHADWTDGTGPVGGFPLPTVGRKIDTRKDLGYTTSFWQAACAQYETRERTGVTSPAKPVKGDLWDGRVPYLDVLVAAQGSNEATAATYRLAARLYDLGHYAGRPILGVTAYPRKAIAVWQQSHGYQATGNYGPVAQQMIFGAT